jgi:toxin ParE1/3/4
MSETEIIARALKLPVRKRERLAEALLGSVKRPSRRHIEALWAQEGPSQKAMTVEFLAPAATEYRDAFDWYDQRSTRAADGFRETVFAAIQRAIARPTSAGFLVGTRVRTVSLKPYDYGLLYFVQDQHLYVVAIAHNKRRPNYWSKRLTWI